jgi:1-acyl-sn-glycerol-3-phosphate acyltransferase
MPVPATYAAVLARGRQVNDGIRIGRPGRSRAYWPLYAIAQGLRLRYAIRVHGRHHVAPGPAILIGNHLSMTDPVLVGVTNRWRMAFFTKIEAYRGPSAWFLCSAGQIPLRRGDEESTRWALDMSHEVLGLGTKLCVYPEGTRSPDGVTLHRLHRRVLVPILQANPDVPVHAMVIGYGRRRRGRIPVELRFSPALDIDATVMSANEVTDAVRDALLTLGGMPYFPAFAQRVKDGRGRDS